jgi:hypothetical protein
VPISSFSNPIPEIIDGLLRGQEMGMRMRAAQRADQEFKTQQALHNSQMSMNDIVAQNAMQQMGRRVSSMGTVDSPSLSSALLQPSGSVSAPMSNAAPTPTPDGNAPTLSPAQLPKAMPGMGDQQSSMPGYTRKADKSRTVTYTDRFGNKTSSELYTPEEQQQRALTQQTSGMDALQAAKDRAAMNSAQALHNNQLKLEGGGTPAQGLSLMGVPDGTMLTRDELAHYTQGLLAHIQSQQEIRKGNERVLGPGQQLIQTEESPTPGVPGQPGMEPIAIPPAQVPGLPANLQPRQAGATATPPLANNPTVQRMRVIASGGPANPTGEYAEFKGAFLPGYYQDKGITNPQPKDEMDALAAFRADKKKKEQPEWAANETELAQRASSPDPKIAGPAEAALKRLDQSRLASRPITQITMPGLGPGSASQANPQVMGEDFMKTLPAGTAAQVRAIANGSATIPPAGSRNQSAMYLRDAVFRYDPTYTDQRAQVRKAFTTGKDGTNIGNLNTATVHLDQMAEAAKAMQNGTWQPGNQLYNYVATKFGAAAPTNYQTVMNAFSGEAANALKGSATDPEIAHVMSTLSPNMSPQQAAGVANTNLHIIGSKLNTYHERYQQQIPNDTVYSPVLPSARAVFQKYGMTETGASAKAGGNTQPGQAPQYQKTATAPNGHKIGYDGKNWVDIQTGQRVQ